MSLKSIANDYIGYAVNNTDDPEKLSGERGKLLGYCYTANFMANMYGGNFYTGLLLLMNANDAFMGILSIINTAVGILPVFSAVFLGKYERRKKILVLFRIIVDVLNIACIGIIPLLGISEGAGLSAVLAIAVISGSVANIMNPAISVWHIRLIPEKKRACYFSFLNISVGILSYVVMIAASALLDHFKAMGYELQTMLALRAVALIFMVVEVLFLVRIKEYPITKTDTRINVINIFKKAVRSGRYLISVGIGCMYSFVTSIAGPYFSIYLLKDLQLGYSYLSIVSVMYMPFMILLNPVWSRIITRTSWNRTLYYCLALSVPTYCILPFTSSGTMFIYPIACAVSYIASPGFGLVFANNMFQNLPERDQTELLGFYSTMTNIAALCGVTLGKWFIDITGGKTINLFGIQMINKQYILFLISAGLIIMTVVLLFINRNEKNRITETEKV